MRINVGCGQRPTKGWRNFDNSLSLRFARIPFLPGILHKIGLIENSQYQFIQFVLKNQIEYGNATRGLPIENASVDVLYSSHMIEHLDKEEAAVFLKEAFRLLRPGGIIRIAVPDLKKKIDLYNEFGDADAFIESTRLCVNRPKSLTSRLRLLLVGTRHHQWMYDGNSMSRLLQNFGFINVEVKSAGQTKIQAYEPLDIHERALESVYIEAVKPTI